MREMHTYIIQESFLNFSYDSESLFCVLRCCNLSNHINIVFVNDHSFTSCQNTEQIDDNFVEKALANTYTLHVSEVC